MPLEHAAAEGDIDLFTKLVGAGADTSAGWRGVDGRTLLGAAAYGRNEEIVLALLAAGAKDEVNVFFDGAKRESALQVAAARGAEAAANALMVAGADPNLGDETHRTPLHYAADAGYHRIVNSLLLKGADPNAKTCWRKYTPIHLAAKKGHARCVAKLLLGGAVRDVVTNIGRTPLYMAVHGDHAAATEELLDAGANADIRFTYTGFPSKRRVVDIAAYMGNVESMRALLWHGCDICGDKNGFTALHNAALSQEDNGAAVRLLLEAGADVNARSDDGVTPLHNAASIGTMRALLEGGADADAAGCDELEDYCSPLHTACQRSSDDAVELLLRWGADETLGWEDGSTPADLVGSWDEDEDEDVNGQRNATDQRILDMLARAPADRCWRRRGWLLLYRAYPVKLKPAEGSGGTATKVTSASCYGSGGGGGETRDFTDLVGRVVDMEADEVFRSVVGFL